MSRKPKSEQENIGNAVEELRIAAGLSRQDLADQVGVHYQTVGYIERGEYSPSLVLALRIAAALNEEIENIFWIEED